MKQINSDLSPTMIACKKFNEILNQIQHSGLNFQLQLSPFGAFISLKKSLVKDKKGNSIIPPSSSSSIISGSFNDDEDMAALKSKILLLENKLEKLQNDYACGKDDSTAANIVIEAITKKNESMVDLENEMKVSDRKIEKNEKHTEVEKQKNYESKREDGKKDENTNEAKENTCIEVKPGGIEALDVDLNYNVIVSNSFSPLLYVDGETPSSSKPPPPTPPTPVSLKFRESTPASPCNASGRDNCSDLESTLLPSSLVKPGSTSPELPLSISSPESPQTEAAASETNEEETVLFEGKLISKQDAFKKILEAVQEMNSNFNP